MYVNKYETETELLINKQVFINIYIVVTMLPRGGHFNIKKYTSNCPVRKTSAMTLNLLNVF